jgi:hypothetical protein
MTTTGATTAITLPIGLWRDGGRIKEAVLRPMTGADQEFLLEAGVMMPPAIRTSELLARCVQRIGREGPVTPPLAAELVAGDREALLLHLRRITFGNQMDLIVSCPACAKNMDAQLKVSDLLVSPGWDAPQFFERDLPSCGTLRFRMPCGADQEAVADMARHDAAGAAVALLHRCIEETTGETPEGALPIIGGWMAELDPQAEIRLRLICPECGHEFVTLLDAGSYLFEESTMRSRELYREIHLLAFHYHWSEAEILGMAPIKRRRYLEMLLEALE